MKSKFIYIVSNDEKDIYQIEYAWRSDNYLTKLVFTKYQFSVKQVLVAEVVWYCTVIERAREVWHKIAGWQFEGGLSIATFTHSNHARNVEPQYLKYNKRVTPIDLKYFQLLEDVSPDKIEFFRRLPIT
jgi:hypothetical protein